MYKIMILAVITVFRSNRFHDTSCHTYVALFPVDMLCSALCQELSSANKGHDENSLKRDLAIHGLAKMVGQKDKEVLGRSVCSVKLRMFSSKNYWKVMEYIVHGSKNQIDSNFFNYFGAISLRRMRRFDLLTTYLDQITIKYLKVVGECVGWWTYCFETTPTGPVLLQLHLYKF